MSSSDSNETKKYDNMNKSVGTSISSLTESGGYQPLQPGDIGINIGYQSFTRDSTNPFHNNILAAINVGRNSVPIPELTDITPLPLNRNLTNENLNGIYTNLNRIIESVGGIYNNLNSNSSNPNSSNPNSSNPNSSNPNSSNPNSSNSSNSSEK